MAGDATWSSARLVALLTLLTLAPGCNDSEYALNAPAPSTLAGAGGGGTSGLGAGGAPSCSPPLGAALCDEVPALTNVALDGQLDCGASVQLLDGGTTLSGLPASPIALALAWTSAGVYWFVDVEDAAIDAPEHTQEVDPVFCGDAIELHLDDNGEYVAPPAYDDPGTIHIVVPRGDSGVPAGTFRGNMPVAPADPSRIVVRERPGGWTLEALMTASELGLTSWAPQPGSKIGFSLAVDYGASGVLEPSGECQPPVVRDDQWLMAVAGGDAPCGEPFCDVRAFCNPFLR